MLLNQRQAIDARLKQTEGEGTVRSTAPGTTFHLADHPEHPNGQGDDDHFLVTAVHHHARNNLNEQLTGALDALGPVGDPTLPPPQAGEGWGGGKEITSGNPLSRPFDTPVDHYRNRLVAQRAAIPWRPLFLNTHGRHIHPRPTVRGTLTAIVVGDGGPTHTDRDGRIRIQFPWQRGNRGASRNPHPTGSDNATGDASLGVWLRVVMPVAGGNWGGHLIPRPGQEVIVAFQNGNIDRPIVTGAVYNGQGNDDAPGNRVSGNALEASANAPAWFAGKGGEHAHGASLSGLKSQQLSTSRSGGGGYNQLVFDDTPGESRIGLSTTQYRSSLQLGHLKQQTDNARQKNRGHGGELATQAALALRAGAGLLLSADARPNAGSTQLDSTEAIARTEAARQLSESLSDLAEKQNATLPANQSLQHAREALETTASRGPAQSSGSQIKTTLGGTGTVPAWSEPRIQTSAPGGIAQLTPANHILVSGTNTVLVAEHDTQLLSQGSHALAGKEGLALFAHGKSKKANKPNQETGIHLHAASGKVSLQAQSGNINAAADQRVTFASTHADLNASAKQKILATAKGAYLKLEGGNIELHAPGKVEFKASMKNWTGPKSIVVNTSTGFVLISEVIKPKDKVPYFSFSG
jgi:type VI secretion system secreted protein VgrG